MESEEPEIKSKQASKRDRTLLRLLKFRYSEKATKLAHLPLFIWHYLVASNHKWKMG
jgi:hypothetical protein